MKLRSLQALRFLAALGVVQSHTLNGGYGGLSPGAFGVDVFFVISGFIIMTTARGSPLEFARDRLVRVLPPYYVVLAGVLWFKSQAAPLDPERLIASVMLWPAFGTIVTPYLNVAWTLCFEMLFYACMTAVRAGVRPRWILLAYAGCWALAALTGLAVFAFLGAPIILEFLFGVALALYPVRSRPLGVAALAVAGLAGGAFFLFGTGELLLEPASPANWLRPFVVGVPAALLVFGVLQFETAFQNGAGRALGFLGDASYSLYLTHVLTISFMMKTEAHAGPALTALVCVGVGCLVYLMIERPLLGLLRAPWRASGAVPSTSAS